MSRTLSIERVDRFALHGARRIIEWLAAVVPIAGWCRGKAASWVTRDRARSRLVTVSCDRARRCAGLTLVELIVVLTVLVALGGLVVPILSGFSDDAQKQVTQETLRRVRDAIQGPGGYASTMRFAEDELTAGDPVVGFSSGLPWPTPTEIAGGRANHPQLHWLFEKPAGLGDYDATYGVGWRSSLLDISAAGLYDTGAGTGFNDSNYGVGDGRGDGITDDDLTPIDGWGRPIVIQLPDVSVGVTDQEIEHVRLVSAGEDGVIDTPSGTLAPNLTQKDDDVVLYLRIEDPFPGDGS